MVTTGAIRRAKHQSECHHRQTKPMLGDCYGLLPPARMLCYVPIGVTRIMEILDRLPQNFVESWPMGHGRNRWILVVMWITLHSGQG